MILLMRKFLAIFISLMFAIGAAVAQEASARPNFTGIWNMDLEKSNFGGLEPPHSARYLIRHLGAKIEMQYEQDGKITRVDVIPDGEEHVLETGPDTENIARVYWSGPVLVYEGRIRPMTGSHVPPVKWTSRWSVSSDKRFFTIERHMATEQSSVDQKIVFEKQPAAAKGQ